VNHAHPVASAFALMLIASGSLVLLASLISPRLLRTQFMRWMVFGNRLEPTRSNQVLIAIWAMLFGGGLLLFMHGYRTLSFIAFLAWAPVTAIMFKRMWWPATQA
jgi:hypothetical protein